MRIALINSVVANGGDAAILLGTLGILRTAFGPETTFTVFDAMPEVARAHYPEVTVHPPLYTLAFETQPRNRVERKTRFVRWLVTRPRLYAAARLWSRPALAERLLSRAERERIAALAEADLVLGVGGTYLVENYWLGPTLFEFGMVRRLGLPYALMTQSMGPFRKPRVRAALRRLLSGARLVLLRDEASRRHVENLDVDVRAEVSADAAFALADGALLRQAQAAAWPADRPPRVAVSVREWPYFETTSAERGMAHYEASIAAAVTHLVREHNAEVTFLSTCQGIDGYRYDDSAVASRIAGTLTEAVRANVTVARDYHRPEALLELLAAFDLVIATRMHVAILALSAGTPVLPIAYEFKTRVLSERLGLGAWVQDIEAIRPEALVAAVGGLVEHLPSLRATLFERVEAERDRAMQSGERLREAIVSVAEPLVGIGR